MDAGDEVEEAAFVLHLMDGKILDMCVKIIYFCSGKRKSG